MKKDLSSRVNALIDSLKAELRHIDEDDYEIPDHIIDAFVERIVVHEDHFDWYLRCGKEECIGCRMKGTRRTNAEIDFSLPSLYYSPTGSHKTGEIRKVSGYLKVYEMGFSRDDAIDYLYSIDNRRRIQGWRDFKEKIIFEAMKKVITEVVAFFIVSNVKSLHDYFIITKSYFLLDNSQ